MDEQTTTPASQAADRPEYVAPCVEHVLTAEDLEQQALYGAPASFN